MANSIVISADWVNQIRRALDGVETSGQAWAAIDASVDFAHEAADAIRASGSWWERGDPWQEGAASDLENQATQVDGLKRTYSEDSSQPVGDEWASVHRGKVLYLYNLAQISRQGYPADKDTGLIDSVLSLASANLFSALANAPKTILEKGKEIVETTVDTAVDVGKKLVGGAVTLAGQAAQGIKETAETLIPWKLIGAVVLLGGGLVVGLYYLGKSGTLKLKVPL